jgi:hypothetical protein
VKASTINPIAEIVLIVNSSECLEERFTAHTVSAEKRHLSVDGPRYRASERFF